MGGHKVFYQDIYDNQLSIKHFEATFSDFILFHISYLHKNGNDNHDENTFLSKTKICWTTVLSTRCDVSNFVTILEIELVTSFITLICNNISFLTLTGSTYLQHKSFIKKTCSGALTCYVYLTFWSVFKKLKTKQIIAVKTFYWVC